MWKKDNTLNGRIGGSAGKIASPSRATLPHFWSVRLGES
jgi:hypothetical protein